MKTLPHTPHTLAFFVLLASMLVGCAPAPILKVHPDTPQFHQQFNREARGRHVNIQMRDGTRHRAVHAQMGRDGLSWFTPIGKHHLTAGEDIVSLTIKKRRRGLSGFFASLTGMVIGATVGHYITKDTPSTLPCTPIVEATCMGRLIVTSPMSLGALAGLVTGLALEAATPPRSEMVYTIGPRSSAPASRPTR